MLAIATTALVRRLVSDEAEGRQDDDSLLEAASQVGGKLRAHLSNRIGREGFRTLLSRAAVLTLAQYPDLSIRVEADGSLVSLQPARPDGAQHPPSAQDMSYLLEQATAVLAQFVELLITLIGTDLTLRILGSVWANIAADEATISEIDRS